MKKVISITLGSIVFAIEEDAYDALAAYLTEIKNNLAHTADSEEITSDIETAIAEKFLARARSEKIAVTTDDVAAVIAEMGSPGEFKEEASDESGASEAATLPKDEKPKRRLYRDPDDVVIAGVASGLANYFAIDPVIVRLAFVVVTLFSGLGILAYVILWLIVPEAKTTTEKYAMRGVGTTVEDITNRVKKNLSDLDSQYSEQAKGVWRKIRDFLSQVFVLLAAFIKVLLKIVQYGTGAFLMIMAAIGIAALVGGMSAVSVSDGLYVDERVADVHEIILAEPTGYVFLAAVCVVLLIPLLVCLLAGVSLLLSRNLFSVLKAVMLFVIWLSAAALILALAMIHGERVVDHVLEVSEEWSTDTRENPNDAFHLEIPPIDDIPPFESPDAPEVPEMS